MKYLFSKPIDKISLIFMKINSTTPVFNRLQSMAVYNEILGGKRLESWGLVRKNYD